MVVESWKEGNGENDVRDEEEAVVLVADTGQGGGVEEEQRAQGCETKDDVEVLEAFEEERGLHVEVQVEGTVDGEEDCEGAAEEAVVGV